MNDLRLVLACLLSVAPVLAQVSAPRVGLVRYTSGAVYPVYGVQGNYVVGQRLFDSVDALSFSNSGGLLSRHGNLLLIDKSLAIVASFDAASTAVVSIQSGLTSAIAWLPARHILVSWNGQNWYPTILPDGALNGSVLALSKESATTATVLVKTTSGAVEEDSVTLEGGQVRSRVQIPGVTGTIYRQGNSLLSLQSGELLLTSLANGSHKNLPASHIADILFESMSETSVHIHSTAGQDWLVHFDGDSAILFELPVPAAESSAPQVSQ